MDQPNRGHGRLFIQNCKSGSPLCQSALADFPQQLTHSSSPVSICRRAADFFRSIGAIVVNNDEFVNIGVIHLS